MITEPTSTDDASEPPPAVPPGTEVDHLLIDLTAEDPAIHVMGYDALPRPLVGAYLIG